MFFNKEIEDEVEVEEPSVPTSNNLAPNSVPESRESNDDDEKSESEASITGADWTEVATERKTRYGRKTGRTTGVLDPSTGQTVKWADISSVQMTIPAQNYYESLTTLEQDNVEVDVMKEFAGVGAGVGGGFSNTTELKPMKFDEAMNGPDAEGWRKEVDNEHERMVHHGVFEPVEKSEMPPGATTIDSSWVMKKKSNGTLRGRVTARGFKQRVGEHYDPASISAPVTCPATIRIVLVIMLMAGWTANVVDVKGAFLHGRFTDGEEIFMKIPRGFEKHYSSTAVLKLMRCLYGLKQAAMAFWRQLLLCMKDMKFERSTADPCLYFQWGEFGLVLIVSWIDDNLIVGSEKGVKATKEDLMGRFDCEDCGDMDEYVGCLITRIGNTLKFTQPVLLQSLQDEFELPDAKFATPARAGNVLTKCTQEEALNATDQTKYRSGVGKLLHMMQWSRPDCYNCIRDLSRHMSMAAEKHMQAMTRCMKSMVDRPNRGLTLKPDADWDGNPEFEFTIGGRSDSDYAKCPDTRRSVSGGRVLLNGAPVMFKSATQKHVSLSVTESELYAGVTCAQDMLYVKNVMESIGLKVKLPMVLETDNKGTADLANSWSIGGRTRHIDVRQVFLRELKEAGVIKVIWVAGCDNDADIFTKNLDGPLFERFAKVFLGVDEYTPKSLIPE